MATTAALGRPCGRTTAARHQRVAQVDFPWVRHHRSPCQQHRRRDSSADRIRAEQAQPRLSPVPATVPPGYSALAPCATFPRTIRQVHRSQPPPHPPSAPLSKMHATSAPKISSDRSLPLLTTTVQSQKSLFARPSHPGKPQSGENTIASRWLAKKLGRVCLGGWDRWAGCG
jgi:hypothetical protein